VSAERFFVEGVARPGEERELAPDDARKAAVVLRKRAGDGLEIVDSGGTLFAARIVRVTAYAVVVRLEAERAAAREPRVELTLLQGVPKGAKMDFVVEKATELGVARIVPLVTQRVQGDAASAAKVERWRRLAKAASQQCGRRTIAAIDEPRRLADALSATDVPGYDAVLVAWEVAERVPLRDRLPALLEGRSRVAVAIGPEGGFARDEVTAALAAGATAISLGERILRTETAGLVLCAAIRYATGEL